MSTGLVACLLGVLSTATASAQPHVVNDGFNIKANALECGYRKLMYSKVLAALEAGTPGSNLDAFESLELGTMCGEVTPPVLAMNRCA